MSSATFNSRRVTSARVNIPKRGVWYADVAIDGEHALSGRVTLVIADLTLSGTIISGGPAKGRSSYCIVGGAAGWGKTLKAYSYADDAGVKFATIIGDAAKGVGETIATIDPTLRTGPAFVRQAAPASELLEIFAPNAWYVDELGVTHLGARTPGKLPAKVTRVTPVDARGKVILASESIATILPGVVVDGLTAVDVLHEISATGGLRSTIWGAQAGSPLDSLAGLLEQLDPHRSYRGVTEYRVVTKSAKRLNLQPVRASSGMPDLLRVPVRPGIPGADCSAVALGSRVLVGFVDSDPSRPYVASFEDADGAGFVPATLTLRAGAVDLANGDDTDLLTQGVGRVVRYGDPIVFSAPGPGTVLPGAVLNHFSKVKA